MTDRSGDRGLLAAGNDPGLLAVPWLSRKDWSRGVMRDNVGLHADVYVLILFGPVFLAASVEFYRERLHLGPPGSGFWLPVTILGLSGAGMTFRAIQLLWRWVAYGGSRLTLASVPVPLGGVLKADLIMSRRLPAGRLIRATLKCMSATTKWDISIDQPFRGNDRKHIEHHIVWQDEDLVASDGSGRFRIAFAVPADQPATTLPDGFAWRYWVLEIADPSGAWQAYRAEFELPIFAVPLGADTAADVAAVAAARRRRLEDYQPGPGSRVRIGPAPGGGTEFFLPPLGTAGGAIAQTIVLLASIALITLAWRNGFPLVITVPWGVINLLLFVWVIRLWSAEERIVVGNGTIRVTSGLLGLTRSMPLDQVRQIHAVRIASPWIVTVRIMGHGWQMIGCGQGIREAREAEWLALRMSRTAGIEPAGPIPVNEWGEQLQVLGAFAEQMTGAEGRTAGAKLYSMIKDRARRMDPD
ncbi:MAG TPA: hypothetical protein VKS60_19870 [Stellaceae bacterium]|nr:hypothetical protein [Stellaceae bacterium]